MRERYRDEWNPLEHLKGRDRVGSKDTDCHQTVRKGAGGNILREMACLREAFIELIRLLYRLE